MNRNTGLVALIGLLLMPTAVHAQATQSATTPQITRCAFNGKDYTAGALVRSGAIVLECASWGAWSKSASTSANCFFQSELYSAGAVLVFDNKQLTCNPDGTWK